jgi:hypothetical protein
MSHDPVLVERIKSHFASKSSAQLREIAQSNEPERWSAEAVAAARDVLADRAAGRAHGPAVSVDDPPTPAPAPIDAYSLSWLALGLAGLGGGLIVLPTYRVDYAAADPDLPIPFGPRTAWVAVDTTDTEAVAAALGLQDVRPATWAEGIAAAAQSALFVTPPLADWTLAVGTALFPPDRIETFVQPLVEHLSRRFGDAQYFCTHQDHGLHAWARAKSGRLVRGFGWLGAKSLPLWNEGRPTKEERDLGYQFVDSRSADGTAVDENAVMQVAFLWSIDPTSLDVQIKEPSTGLLGSLATLALADSGQTE